MRALELADLVKDLGPYRWAGIYDVGSELVSIVAWSGLGPPAYPSFPLTEELTGAAIAQRSTIVVADVRHDSRYLTAFGSTLSEIIVPVTDPVDGSVLGTIDVESERTDAFSEHDRSTLEECARLARPLWRP